jgi:chromosome segregation ATPase
MKEDLKQLNKTYSEPLEKLHKFERTMKISLQAVDHATKAIKFITERHDTTKNRRVELDDQVKEASEELKILMSACNGKKVEFDQRHTSRKEELETMGDLVQFLHQQLVIQQQKLSDSVELLKSGNLN